MKLKPGVSLRGVKPETVLAIAVANSIYGRVSQGGELVLTSVTDGLHMGNSRHYTGYAFDLRLHDLPDAATKASLRAELSVGLGADFDVLQEHLGEPEEHIHVEFDPKM